MNDVPLKPAMTTAEHIILLQERGMHVDEELAQQWLRNVFYYRLSAYWYPCRKWGEASDGSKKRLNKFMPDTNFADAVALYEADRKLRTLIYDGIERVEVGFRTRICELLLAKNPDDPLLYRDESIFREKFDHQKWLKTADNRVKRAIYNRNRAVQHYSKKYEKRYPLWVLMDVLDFSDISRLYSGLKSSDQHKIATELGIEIDWNNLSPNMRKKARKKHPLAQWLHQLSIIRNTCAHHVRLWNKSFIPASTKALRTMPEFLSLPDDQSERIYGALVFIKFLLKDISPGSTWGEKMQKLISEEFLSNPIVTRKSMGLPDSWPDESWGLQRDIY